MIIGGGTMVSNRGEQQRTRQVAQRDGKIS